MSKKRHRSRESNTRYNSRPNNMQQNNRMNNGNNNPFGINPAQLLNLFGGLDINQLGNMLSSMGRDGVDLSNFAGLGNMMQQNTTSNNRNVGKDIFMDSNQEVNDIYNDIVNSPMGKSVDNDKKHINKNSDITDENIRFLNSIKEIADPSKSSFIDKIIKKYLDGELDD